MQAAQERAALRATAARAQETAARCAALAREAGETADDEGRPTHDGENLRLHKRAWIPEKGVFLPPLRLLFEERNNLRRAVRTKLQAASDRLRRTLVVVGYAFPEALGVSKVDNWSGQVRQAYSVYLHGRALYARRFGNRSMPPPPPGPAPGPPGPGPGGLTYVSGPAPSPSCLVYDVFNKPKPRRLYPPST